MLWSKEHPARGQRFEWALAGRYLRVPVLRKLFHEVAEPGQLESMNLPEVLEWAGAALDRVDRASFFDNFEEGHAVQYFYEPFLEAFDPELRKDLGVWYTPVEVVRYMVGRVDAELRHTLGVADGLADPSVYILDPCCGTGAFLVEVLRRIAETLREKGGDALTAQDLKQAALERVFGFEILPAPFVVAHLQLGLLLQSLGAPLAEGKRERARVFLTNALTGWEPVKHPKQLIFREMEEEREAAERVKRDTPILVILGNPPYNSFAGIANMEEERGLSEAYRTTKSAPAPQGQGLNDLYVRFFRMADRRIVESTGKGIVAFISNYSWLDGLSFTGMRERYLEMFDRIWVDNLHGDRIISEYAPDGRTSETVFAIEGKSPGIKVGTAIVVMARTGRSEPSEVLYRDRDEARAGERRAALVESQCDLGTYRELRPDVRLGLPFKPRDIGEEYFSWPLLPELFPVSFPGVKTSRDDVVVDIDRERLLARMRAYFDPDVSPEEVARIAPRAMEDSPGFSARETRRYLMKRGLRPEYVVRFQYRPFDIRWLYWERETKLLDRNRAEYFPHVFDGNVWLTASQRNRRAFDPPMFARRLNSLHIIEWSANCFPLLLKPTGALLDGGPPEPNLSQAAADYLGRVRAEPADLFHSVLATLHAPRYAADNASALSNDWPRIPLPATREALLASAALGREIAALLDPEGALPELARCLRPVAPIAAAEGRLDPDAGDLEITAGWGHAGKGGITMPAKGRLTEREMTAEEVSGLPDGAFTILGGRTYDVWLNGRTFWKNVPAPVWEYTLGGYQVLKKWLSYRERSLLGRPLTVAEARYVTEMARRIAAILLLGPALDANYCALAAVAPAGA